MKTFGMSVCFSLCLILSSCSINEPSKTDGGGGSGGTGGNGGSSVGGNADGGSGGTGGNGGEGGNAEAGNASDGGSGGEGGSPPAGPCDEVAEGEIATIFTAPSNHAAGRVGISAYVTCAPGTEAICQGSAWTDPVAGCLASEGTDRILCAFGSYPAATKIRYIAGLESGDNDDALDSWFSWLVTEGINVVGTHIVCRGTEIIGGYDGAFSGVLSDTDEPNKANQMIIVP